MFAEKLLIAVTAVVSFAALPASSQLTPGCYDIAPSGLSGFLAGLGSQVVKPDSVHVVGLPNGHASSLVSVVIGSFDLLD